MFESDYEYGTNGYVVQYANFFKDCVRLVKMKNSEMIVAFVHDDLYTNKVCLSFPYLLTRDTAITFDMWEYTPSLKIKNVTVCQSEISFIKEMTDNLVDFYLDYVKEHVFVNPHGTRTGKDGEQVEITNEETELDRLATVKIDSETIH